MPGTNGSDVIIIGASAAGLACAACLRRRGIPFILLEQSAVIGNEWNNRYDRLHLHTPKRHSQLPYLELPHDWSRYISKEQFVTYLHAYAQAFEIEPHFHEQVIRLAQHEGQWH